MTVFLPDTSAHIEVFRARSGRRKQLLALVSQGHCLACCAVTIGEIYSGMRPHEAAATEEFISSLLWLDTTPTVAKRAGLIRYEWARKGVTLSLTDTLIAATALQYGLTLITDNRKDFPMPELNIHAMP
jgi:predicted nucleic acid-binding protein